MRRIILVLVSAACLSAAAPSYAQDANVSIDHFRKDGNKLSFEVQTPGGPLLQDGNFRISVNDIPAKDLLALPGTEVNEPAGAVLILDTSGSMQGRPIAEAKKAASLFLETVDPTARVSVYRFSTSVRRVAGFDATRTEAIRAVNGLTASGETALYDAVIEAVDVVDSLPHQQRNIILLSDGGDTAVRLGLSDSSLGDAISTAHGGRVKVFAVGLRSEEYNGTPIKRLADATSGRVFLTDRAARLPSLFEDLAKTLVSSYTITITNPDPRATLLDVEVDVLGEKPGSGGEQFSVDVSEEEERRLPPLADIPVPIVLFVVFVGAGLAVFLTSETVREARMSPAERVVWYEAEGGEQIDSDALIQAAVLDRAKELATQLADKAGLLERLEREIEAAGMKWRAGEVIVASIGMSLAASILGFALWGMLAAAIVGLVALIAPAMYIRFNAAKRRRAFVAQLSDVLMLIAGALRAGYSLQQALGAAGEDALPPASEEFRRAMAEIRLGATMDDALRDLARRIGVVDFEWTVMAIRIQREVGGDLAEILEVIAETIRERERLRRHIRALTAEGRLSGVILAALPFVMAGFLLWRQPDYLEPLWTTGLGLFMVGAALFGMIVGGLWMRKIVRIEV